MTQGRTLKELEENLKDAYLLMAMHDVPEEHKVKEIALVPHFASSETIGPRLLRR